jgi:hypothetical protein
LLLCVIRLCLELLGLSGRLFAFAFAFAFAYTLTLTLTLTLTTAWLCFRLCFH